MMHVVYNTYKSLCAFIQHLKRWICSATI